MRTLSVRALLACMVLFLTVPTAASGAAAEPTIETIAGGVPTGLPATEVSVKPVGVDVAPNGDVYIADPGSGVVWRLTPDGILHHFAGSGRVCLPDPARCRGEGIPAKDAFLAAVAGLAVGPNGDVFVSEMRAHVVRRIDQNGRIWTYAGTGGTGYDPAHEGAQAREATLYLPQSLASDADGNLYIADIGNRRIRKVAADGTITTAAGCGSYSFPVCSSWAQDGSPVEGTPVGANAGINGNGWGIAVSPQGELYISDAAQILRLDASQQAYRVVAGKSFQYASGPGQGENGPAIDARFGVTVAMDFAPNGDLVLVEGGGSYVTPWNRIQKIESPAGPQSILRHVGGKGTGHGYAGDGGPATQARFALSQPSGTWTGQGVAVAPNGDIYVSDVINNRLRKIDATGKVTTVAGNGYGGAVLLKGGVHELYPFGGVTTGLTTRGGWSGDGREATTAQLYAPTDVEADRFGNLYVLDRYSQRVRRVAPDGTISTVAGGGCVGEGCSASSAPMGDGGPATQAQLLHPTAIALDRTGTQLYIADSGRARVRQVNMGTSPFVAYPLSSEPVRIEPGEIETVFGPGRSVATQGAPWGPEYKGCGLVKPYCGEGLPALEYSPSKIEGLATDAAGNLYVSDANADVVVRAEVSTSLVTTVAGLTHVSDCEAAGSSGRPGRATQLCGPTALTVGPDGDLYVVETDRMGFGESLKYGWGVTPPPPMGSWVRKVDLDDPLHTTTVVAGKAGVGFGGDGGPATEALLAFPHGVAVGEDGSVYIADTHNQRVRVVRPNGVISTVAGTGELLEPGTYLGCDYTGDGGIASEATLCGPMGLAIGPDGTLYVADQINNAVRAIEGA